MNKQVNVGENYLIKFRGGIVWCQIYHKTPKKHIQFGDSATGMFEWCKESDFIRMIVERLV